MKKILALLAVLALLIAGALYMFLRPVSPTFVAEDFIPSREEGEENFFLLKMEAPGDLAGTLADMTADLASAMDPSGGPRSEGELLQLKLVTHGIKEYSYAFGRTRIYFSVVPGGLMPEMNLYGVTALNTEDPGSFMESLFSGISSLDGDITVIPYAADLGENVIPLYQILDTRSGITISTALFGKDKVFLLFSDGTEGLRKMVSTANASSGKLQLKENLQGGNTMYLSLDTSFLKPFLETEGVALYSEEPIVMEMSFKKDEAGYTVRSHSNAVNIFLSEEQRGSVRPVNGIPELWGDGMLIGLIHARISNLDREKIKEMLLDPEASELKLGLEYCERLYGISVDDMVDLLAGKISVVFGGKASSPVGEIPGMYFIFQPEKKGTVEKFISLVPLLDLPFSAEKTDIDGWGRVYGFELPVSVTIASQGEKLLAGILDPRKLALPAVIPENLAGYLNGESYGIFALSVKQLRQVLMELSESAGPFLPRENIKVVLDRFNEISGRVDSIIAKGESLSDSVLNILLTRETE